MSKKITITIPCYNQTTLLEKNLEHLEKQTFKDFIIVILDDNSSEDYKKVISKFPNLNIEYIRNKQNLGAIKNIFNSIFYKTSTPYKISLHEDDILHPQYLEKAIGMLDDNEKIVFVCTIANWFKNTQSLEKKFTESKIISCIEIVNKTDFIKKILNGNHIAFGSIVYRNSALLNEKPDFEKYDVLCDRPFLISLIKDNLIAMVEDKAIFVRDHGENDTRFSTVNEKNCLNLMEYYKNNLPIPLSTSDNKKMQTFATNNLIGAYVGLTKKQLSFLQFIKKAYQLKLINFKYINRIGIVGLLKLLFGNKIINKLIKKND